MDVHYGFQGGQHAFLGVAVDNPELDSPGLELTFTIRGSLGCALETPSTNCFSWVEFGNRRLVIADPELWTSSDGGLQTTGYLVILEEDPQWWANESWGRIDVMVDVRDACNRRGSASYSYIVGDATTTGTTDSSTTNGSTTDGSTTAGTTGDSDGSTG